MTADSFPDFPSIDTTVERIDRPRPSFTLLDEMMVERGEKADWDLLKELHYKQGGQPLGAHFWKLTLQGETIGVLVTGTAKGMIRERHMVFPNLKPGGKDTRLTNTNRYHYINQNFRVVSRFVIDTMYRGIGAGYRMMNLVSRMDGSRIVEIQSSMSKFNLFGEKAGFRFVTPSNANRYDAVMKFLRSNFESNPYDYEAIVEEIGARPETVRDATIALVKEFYLRNSALENTSNGGLDAERRVAAMSLREAIRGIQQIGLASPAYGVWISPDPAGTVPERLPLSQFDRQKTNERLRLP